MAVNISGPTPLGDPQKFLEALATKGIETSDLNKDKDPEMFEFAKKMQIQSDAFTRAIDSLRTKHNPHACIQDLMEDVWNIIGSKNVRAAIIPSNPVKELSFVVHKLKNEDTMQAMVLLPFNLATKFATNPVYVMGAIVYIGSQVRDFFNGRFSQEQPTAKEMLTRAEMYEAEFLMHCVGVEDFNDYQKQLIVKYPKGIDTHPELLYASKQTPKEKPDYSNN